MKNISWKRRFVNFRFDNFLKVVKSCLIVIIWISLAGSSVSAQSLDTFIHQPAIDSIQSKLNLSSLDSTGLSQRNKLDSIQTATGSKLDSLKHSYDSVTDTADKTLNKYKRELDSLTNLNLPTQKLISEMDSVFNWRESKLAGIKGKADSIRTNAVKEINSLELPGPLKEQAGKLTSTLQKLDITLPKADFANLNGNNPFSGSNTQLPSMKGMAKLPDVKTNIPGTNVKGITDKANNLSRAGSLGEGGKELQQVKQYQQQASDIVPKNAKDIPSAAEKHATELKAVKPVKGEIGKAEQYKETMTKKQDPEAMKQEVLEKSKGIAKEQLAGKDQQIQKAMQQTAKYKKKYSSVQSMADLPKRKPNEMRGKPLIERIVPGVAIQVYGKKEWIADFNPYVGYRFTGRLTAGVGWNQRFIFNPDQRSFIHHLAVYGPRAFAEYKAIKGFSGRAEVETMNTFVPPALSSANFDANHREWVCSVMMGIKKEYRFYKNIKGTVFILYNLYNPNYKSPYSEKLNIRFGFEFPLKKRNKTAR